MVAVNPTVMSTSTTAREPSNTARPEDLIKRIQIYHKYLACAAMFARSSSNAFSTRAATWQCGTHVIMSTCSLPSPAPLKGHQQTEDDFVGKLRAILVRLTDKDKQSV